MRIIKALAWDNEYNELVEFENTEIGTRGFWFKRHHIPPYEFGWLPVYYCNYLSVRQVLRRKRYSVLYIQTVSPSTAAPHE